MYSLLQNVNVIKRYLGNLIHFSLQNKMLQSFKSMEASFIVYN